MHYVKKEKILKEVIVSERTECDVCKKEIKHTMFNSDDVSIEARLGDVYPEGDFRHVHEIDCCGECFRNKIIPLIESSLNVKFRGRPIDDYYAHVIVE